MLCTNFVGIEIYGKKNKERKIVMRPEWVEAHMRQSKFATPPFRCKGTIRASIEAENEPFMGGTDAKLSVTFSCSECGCFNFQPKGFPNDHDLSDWVNLLMSTVDELDYEDSDTRSNRIQRERNKNIQKVMTEQGVTQNKAFDIVLRREMNEARKSLRAKKN